MDAIKQALERSKQQKADARSGKISRPKAKKPSVKDKPSKTAEAPEVGAPDEESSNSLPTESSADLHSSGPQALSEEQIAAFAEAASAADLTKTQGQIDAPIDEDTSQQGATDPSPHEDDPDLWIAPDSKVMPVDTDEALPKEQPLEDKTLEDSPSEVPADAEASPILSEVLDEEVDASDPLADASVEGGAEAVVIEQSEETSDADRVQDSESHQEIRRLQVDVHYLQGRRVIAGKTDPVLGLYQGLVDDLEQRLDTGQIRSLAVTSPTSGCGKTLTAINVAVGLALQQKRKIILVDMDLNRPQVHHYFSHEKLPGISDYLSGQIEVADALFAPAPFDNLWVLPGHVSVAHPTEMLLAGIMARMIDELKALAPSSLLILNVPPMLGTAELGLWSPHMKQVLLVLEHNETTRDELSLTASRLESSSVFGVVMNKVKA